MHILNKSVKLDMLDKIEAKIQIRESTFEQQTVLVSTLDKIFTEGYQTPQDHNVLDTYKSPKIKQTIKCIYQYQNKKNKPNQTLQTNPFNLALRPLQLPFPLQQPPSIHQSFRSSPAIFQSESTINCYPSAINLSKGD